MTDQYRLTIACPEPMIADANQFARCTGRGPDDDMTFGDATWQDASGNLYSVSSGLVGLSYQQNATSALTEPEWGCDMIAAQRAQAVVQVGGAAAPGAIVAVFGDLDGALTELGLTRVPQEGP